MSAALAALAVAVSCAGATAATPSLTLATGPDPAESITTQLIASGTTSNSETSLSMKLKASGGQGCGANFEADGGDTVLEFRSLEEAQFSHSENHEFTDAGSYLLCAWLNDAAQSGDPVVASASLTIVVRPPHLTLAIAAPPVVAVGQTFQLTTTAQAEVARTVTEYVLPNTGRGCPANAEAAEQTAGDEDAYFATDGRYWSVDGGPFTNSLNQTFTAAGQYLVCAYVQYPSEASPPEAAATAVITAVAPPPPCVVPDYSNATKLGAGEQAIRAAGCTVGRVRRLANRHVRAGYVIDFSATAGAHLAAGAPINITVSTGPPCVVPRVLPGTPLGTVELRLLANHCAVGNIRSLRSRRYGRRRVLAVGARTGQVLASHAPITIIVARGHRR